MQLHEYRCRPQIRRRLRSSATWFVASRPLFWKVRKSYLVESRLTPVVRELGLLNISELVSELQKPGSQSLNQRVVEAMTTNETSFFRDIHPFTALKDKILPGLIQRRAKEKSITIWSNACSSGQEPYTIAMVLAEHFPMLKNWKIRLISSDLSNRILDKARLGVFNQTEINRGLADELSFEVLYQGRRAMDHSRRYSQND